MVYDESGLDEDDVVASTAVITVCRIVSTALIAMIA